MTCPHSASECTKVAKTMEAVECSTSMEAAECSKSMKAAKCTEDAKKLKSRNKWKSLPSTKYCEEHAKFCDDESVEKDHVIKDLKPLGATIKDATEWEVIPVGYFFKNGRVKFKYI